MSKARIAIGMSTAAAVVGALGVMAAPAAGARAHGQANEITVIASHLNNPRGLAPAPGAASISPRPGPAARPVSAAASKARHAWG